MRICPKCGTLYPNDAERCCGRDRRCRVATVKVVTQPAVKVEEDSREDLVGQADQIHDLLEEFGALTYPELGKKLKPPVSAKRAARLVSQMCRDGIELIREGSPRKVRIG